MSHLVWSTKYRYKVLTGALRLQVRDIYRQVVGTITSGDWGYRVGLNLAYAFVMPDMAEIGCVMQLDLCGELVAAEVIAPSPYDPEHSRMRA